jgi:hypothetical protein
MMRKKAALDPLLKVPCPCVGIPKQKRNHAETRDTRRQPQVDCGFSSEESRIRALFRADEALKAAGQPGSAEREEEVDLMLRAPECGHFSHVPLDRRESAEWRRWAMQLKRGTNYRMASMAQVHLQQYPRTSAAGLQQLADARAARTAKDPVEKARRLVELHGAHVEYTASLEGRMVVVMEDKRSYLHWLQSPGRKALLTLCLPPRVVQCLREADPAALRLEVCCLFSKGNKYPRWKQIPPPPD